MSETTGVIRCQCTLANEHQITEIFRQFAAHHPATDIDYNVVHEGMNDIGRHNVLNSARYGSGERQCFGCDPLVHMLVKRFNECGHDPQTLFIKPVRRGGRAARLAGLCDVAASRDYGAANDAVPDLRGSPIKAPKRP